MGILGLTRRQNPNPTGGSRLRPRCLMRRPRRVSVQVSPLRNVNFQTGGFHHRRHVHTAKPPMTAEVRFVPTLIAHSMTAAYRGKVIAYSTVSAVIRAAKASHGRSTGMTGSQLSSSSVAPAMNPTLSSSSRTIRSAAMRRSAGTPTLRHRSAPLRGIRTSARRLRPRSR